MNDVRYPNVKVQLTGMDGNAMSIIAAVTSKLRKAGITRTEVDEFVKDAMSGDYDNVLATAMRWVDVS